MKKCTITILMILCGMAVANDTVLNNVILSGGSGTAVVFEDVNEDGTINETYTGINTLQFNSESGLHSTNKSVGVLEIFEGSHWDGIELSNGTYYPDGSEDVAFKLSSEVDDIQWGDDTSLGNKEILWPLMTSFPLTENVSAASHNITSIGTASGNLASFDTFSGKDMTLSGDLTVTSNMNYNVYQQTTIHLGTNYVTNINYYTYNHYETNIIANYTYTNNITTETLWTTNHVTHETYVNNGGYFDASNADWVAFPTMYSAGTNTTFSGAVDFSGADVTGISALSNTTINTISGAVTLSAGDNVTITTNSTTKTLTIAASGGTSSGGMTNAYTVIDGGNVGANVTFNFGLGQVQKYVQTVNVTNTIFSVPDTNQLWEMTALIYSTSNSWNWMTNTTSFLGGDEPDLSNDGWNTVYMLFNPLTTNTTVGLLE